MSHQSDTSSEQTGRNCAMRIIVVDDDNDVRRSLTFGLRRKGFGVDDFASGAELLSLGGNLACDCLLIDFKLPHMDGLSLLRRLREDGLDCPALLITGYYSNILDAQARDVGYYKVIEKPVPVSHLIAHVEEAGRVN